MRSITGGRLNWSGIMWYPLALLLLFIGFHFRGFNSSGDNLGSCRSLLTSGEWFDTPKTTHTASSSFSYEAWQPSGCMMHKYTAEETLTCLRRRKLVLIGDSIVRNLYWALARRLDSEAAGQASKSQDRHSDIVQPVLKGVDLGFSWDPYLNSTHLQREVSSLAALSSESSSPHTAIIIGAGLWHAKYLNDHALARFEKSLDGIFGLYNNTSTQNLHLTSRILMLPVQEPLYQRLNSTVASAMSPDRIGLLNEKLHQKAAQSHVPIVWSLLGMLHGQSAAYDRSGLHPIDAVADRMADIVLNRECNNVLFTNGSYPRDKTCCFTYPEAKTGRALTAAIVMSIPAIVFCLELLLPIDAKSQSFNSLLIVIRRLTSNRSAGCFFVLLMAATFCFFADRTQLFSKVQKRFSISTFLTLCSLSLLLGISSVRSTLKKKQQETLSTSLKTPKASFLSREQTDEWKGWMQFVILIYHYTGASRILWIYKIIRLLVASYLFMTGFGHARFFCRTSDFSLKRSAAVLIRLNLLSCLLPYAMDTDYTFYYFAPLVSYWYAVTWLTMKIKHGQNKNRVFLFGKIMIAAALTATALTLSEPFLRQIFIISEKYANIRGDAREWKFRLELDCVIVFVGMIFGIVLQMLDDQSKDHSSSRRRLPPPHHLGRIFGGICSILTASIYIPIFILTNDKKTYNRLHPYISLFPILTFIMLRNSTRHLRSHYSKIFAFVGQISLETFTLQFHIWLAADTKGILSLGLIDLANQHGYSSMALHRLGHPGGICKLLSTFIAHYGRWIEFCILTATFLCLSVKVAEATQTVTNWIIDPTAAAAVDKTSGQPRVPKSQQSAVKRNDDEEKPSEQGKGGRNASVEAMTKVVHGRQGDRSLIIGGARRLFLTDLRVRLLLIVVTLWTANMVDKVMKSRK